MTCKKCKNEIEPGSIFCGKCGAPVKKKSKAPLYIALIAGVAAIAIVAILLVLNFSGDAYEKQIDIGYDLLEKGDYEEAILAFDKAVEIDEKRPEGYMGKAESMAHDPDMTPEKAKAIVGVIQLGYEKSGDRKVLEHKKVVGEIIRKNGFSEEAEIVEKEVNAVTTDSESPQESKDEEKKDVPDEKIILAYKALIAEHEDASCYVYDIDKNSVPELLIESWTEESGTEVLVYSYEEDIVEIGKIGAELLVLGSLPDENGIIFLGAWISEEKTPEAYVVKLEDGELVYNSISEDGTIVKDGKKTDVFVGECVMAGVDFSEIMDGAVGMIYLVPQEIVVEMAFNTYETPVEAYKDLLKIIGENYMYYYLYDIEKDGVKEIILSNTRSVATDNTYTTVVFSFDGEKLSYKGPLDSEDTFYSYDSEGIICKYDDRYTLHECLGDGTLNDIPTKFIDASPDEMEEIPRYSCTDTDPLDE